MRYVEKKKLPFSGAPVDDRNLPDVHLGLYDDVIVFDHVEKVCALYPLKSLCGKSIQTELFVFNLFILSRGSEIFKSLRFDILGNDSAPSFHFFREHANFCLFLD